MEWRFRPAGEPLELSTTDLLDHWTIGDGIAIYSTRLQLAAYVRHQKTGLLPRQKNSKTTKNLRPPPTFVIARLFSNHCSSATPGPSILDARSGFASLLPKKKIFDNQKRVHSWPPEFLSPQQRTSIGRATDDPGTRLSLADEENTRQSKETPLLATGVSFCTLPLA